MNGLKAFQKTFQPVLERFLQTKLKQGHRVTHDPAINGYVTYAASLVASGGKRIRPYLADVMYRACGGMDLRHARRTWVGLEVFHAFALIHDDVMDEGSHRHGMRTMHTEIAKRLAKTRGAGDLVRIGGSQAILAGDLLFNWSSELLSDDSRVRRIFGTMVDEVIYGQMIDVDLTTRVRTTFRLIEQKMRLKTAGYTIVRPMQIGAAIAGGNARIFGFCERFGIPLGSAFQIQDDLLDLTSKGKDLGKTVFSDLTERQHTLATQYVTERGTRAEKQELARLFGHVLSEKYRPRIMRLLTESGALSYCKRRIERYLADAERAIGSQRLPSKEHQELQELVSYIRIRMR